MDQGSRVPGLRGERESKRSLPLPSGLTGIPPVQGDDGSHVRPNIAVEGVAVSPVSPTGNPVEETPVKTMAVFTLETGRPIRRLVRSPHFPPFSLRHHSKSQGAVGDFDVEISHDRDRFRQMLLGIFNRGLEEPVEIVSIRPVLIFNRSVKIIHNKPLFLSSGGNPHLLPSSVSVGTLQGGVVAGVGKAASSVARCEKDSYSPIFASVFVYFLLALLGVDGARLSEDDFALRAASHSAGYGVGAPRFLESPHMHVGSNRHGVQIVNRIEIPGSHVEGVWESNLSHRSGVLHWLGGPRGWAWGGIPRLHLAFRRVGPP